MPVFKPDTSKANGVDEFTTQAANAGQLVVELDTDEPDHPGLEAGPVEEDAAEEVSEHRGPLQTREAYLKKGEDLIRSLL